jgi:hypothetical protein
MGTLSTHCLRLQQQNKKRRNEEKEKRGGEREKTTSAVSMLSTILSTAGHCKGECALPNLTPEEKELTPVEIQTQPNA